ncbi:hypothetical protein H0E87_021953 [Populus deltoides]|uniref:Cyclic nucleotide-binding domain-containing protein n=1 Tax=Populus deltoides TaxID=3696 RepID=A0A8T2XHG3_POPDE|nr:hypothetical protein H0E87_021953 [Populus deltoides]
MAGEIGVVFNIPQPFTVRTRRLSQVIRLSHHHLKQMAQPHSEDGKKIISNFIQYLKDLKREMQEEIPFLRELLEDTAVEKATSNEGLQSSEALNSQRETSVEGKKLVVLILNRVARLGKGQQIEIGVPTSH